MPIRNHNRKEGKVYRKNKILIVDNDYSSRQTMRLILEDKFDVTTTNADDALVLLNTTEFEVVIVDLFMPKISGLEILKWIKGTKPLTEVIIVTGYASVETTKHALKAGAFDYIQKPFDPKGFQETINKAFEHRTRRLLEAEEESGLVQTAYALEQEIRALRQHRHQTRIELLSRVINLNQKE